MAAFVGYCVQANGFYFPWRLTGGPNPIMHADISAAGSPAEQWDALPIEAKYQIIVRRSPLVITPSYHPANYHPIEAKYQIIVRRTPLEPEPATARRWTFHAHVEAPPWTGRHRSLPSP